MQLLIDFVLWLPKWIHRLFVGRLVKKIDTLESEIERQRRQFEDYVEERVDLRAKVSQLRLENEVLKSNKDRYEGESGNLHHSRNELEKKCAVLDSKQTTLLADLVDQKTKSKQLAVELEKRDNDYGQVKQLLDESENLRRKTINDGNKVLKVARGYKRLAIKLNQQIDEIASIDGEIWDRDVESGLPSFTKRSDRKTKIVSVVNLKGGVGKTTLTANIGATLAYSGQRVLLIDLDSQHHLSKLCFPQGALREIWRANQSIQEVFRTDGTSILSCVQRDIGGLNGKLSAIASGESLARIETQAMASWLVRRSQFDVRYVLRRVLHSPTFASEEYDWVLLDCPPRWTTASINGLCCSDFVLIPVVPDVLSVRSLPQILKWLRGFKTEKEIWPDLEVIGIIANLTRNQRTLTPNENDAFSDIDFKTLWGEDVNLFRTFFARSKKFTDAVDGNSFAALVNGTEFRRRFEQLIEEMNDRINNKVLQNENP